MLARKPKIEPTHFDSISIEQYLAFELSSEIKHELVDGQIYAMTGASENHNYIAGNIFSELHNHLKNSSCRPFTSDMKIKTARGNFRYPDVMVVCDKDQEDPYYKTQPVILIEVISSSTRKVDRKDKLLEYINIPSLQEYLIIEQDFVDIEVFKRSQDWHSTHYFLGEEITLESIDLTLKVEDVYYRVNNPEMMEFLKDQND